MAAGVMPFWFAFGTRSKKEEIDESLVSVPPRGIEPLFSD